MKTFSSSAMAELAGRAVVAAARVYGDDPVAALLADAGSQRRAVTAAAGGLAKGAGLNPGLACEILRVRRMSLDVSRNKGNAQFREAQEAAEFAVADTREALGL